MLSHDFLRRACEGAAITTRSGRPARIICIDRLSKPRDGKVLALCWISERQQEVLLTSHQSGANSFGLIELDLLIKE